MSSSLLSLLKRIYTYVEHTHQRQSKYWCKIKTSIPTINIWLFFSLRSSRMGPEVKSKISSNGCVLSPSPSPVQIRCLLQGASASASIFLAWDFPTSKWHEWSGLFRHRAQLIPLPWPNPHWRIEAPLVQHAAMLGSTISSWQDLDLAWSSWLPGYTCLHQLCRLCNVNACHRKCRQFFGDWSLPPVWATQDVTGCKDFKNDI